MYNTVVDPVTTETYASYSVIVLHVHCSTTQIVSELRLTNLTYLSWRQKEKRNKPQMGLKLPCPAAISVRTALDRHLAPVSCHLQRFMAPLRNWHASHSSSSGQPQIGRRRRTKDTDHELLARRHRSQKSRESASPINSGVIHSPSRWGGG